MKDADAARPAGNCSSADSGGSSSGNEAATAPAEKAGKRQRPRHRCLHCCKGCLICVSATLALLVLVALIAHGGSAVAAYQSFSFAMMRFFRDLSRAKARQRRFGQKNALMPLLLRQEEPLPLADASLGLGLTLDELAEYDGRTLPDSAERAPLFLAIHGRIYDVSAGWAFYGPGRSYHKLVGKDATRAFCTGCLEPDCLIANTDGLSDKQLREAHRWIELYEHHDKYKLVGALREEAAAAGVSSAAEEEEEEEGRLEAEAEAAEWAREQVARAQAAEKSKKHRPFRPR